MNIFIVTPIYATTTSAKDGTPVVHYFAREWVKMGHKVTVFQFAPKFLGIYYWVSRHFQHQLNTKLGIRVPLDSPVDDDYVAEGVTVHRRCFRKIIPHSLYPKKIINKAIEIINAECGKQGVPDWFIGHWDNPQLELLTELKQRYNKPIGIVFHGVDYDFEKKYGKKGVIMLKQLDVIGFRSQVGQRNFIKKYWEPKKTFVASSGVSAAFLDAGKESQHTIMSPVHNFIFVGTLISRKFPAAIISSLIKAFPDGNFKMTYIGDGAERGVIEAEYKRLGSVGELVFTGRIPREQTIRYLKESDVFIMISKNETFGLVYLEAMALGIVPIGSKDGGIDGVINDGKNGFLCEAGNIEELTELLKTIKNMPSDRLRSISEEAQKTAIDYSDFKVAERYLKALTT